MSRLAIDVARRAELLVSPPDRALPAADPDDGEEVRAALDRLGPRQRAVVLRFYCDLSVP